MQDEEMIKDNKNEDSSDDKDVIDDIQNGEVYDSEDAFEFNNGSIDPLGNVSLPENKDLVMQLVAKSYLDGLDKDVYHRPEDVANDILVEIRRAFGLYNETAPKGGRWGMPDTLPPEIVSPAMLELHTIKNINCAGSNCNKEYDLLAIYQDSGPNAGIYVSDETEIRNLIRRYNSSLKTKDVKEVIALLKDNAPRTGRCSDPDLIAVNNGIFNYKTKIVNAFDPDIVFTAKCRVDYSPTAKNVIIHNDDDNTDWDVESWVKELFDPGSDIPETIWQIIGAIVRPNVRWNKSAWFVSEKGNNGKGTLCHLMRNLVGEGTYAAIPLSDFGKDFMLEPLIHASCIITDENDVGTFIDKAANLKAVITNDVIQINRKFKIPVAYQFRGFMVQCVNELFRTKDKSESFYRRQIFIPFNKCYTGVERKYIKDDYLNRQDVLEYVLHRILNMNYYEITEPDSCKEALAEYKIYNDPVRDFLVEITGQLSWGCVPNDTLLEMYQNWSKINNPNGGTLGRNTFLNDVKNTIDSVTTDWFYTGKGKRTRDRMNCDEPLLDKFNCVQTMLDPKSANIAYRVRPKHIPPFTRGLFRSTWAGAPKPMGTVIDD